MISQVQDFAYFDPQVLFVSLYQMWFAQGYQEFAGIESSVTTKVGDIGSYEQPEQQLEKWNFETIRESYQI